MYLTHLAPTQCTSQGKMEGLLCLKMSGAHPYNECCSGTYIQRLFWRFKKKKGKKGTIAAVVRLKQYGNKKSRKSVRPRALCCSAHREQFI